MPSETTSLIIKEWAKEDRPREKLLQKGRSALTDAELLGILINTGIQNHTAVDLAKQILATLHGDLNKLATLTVNELAKFKGIGQAKAITIVAALEIGRRRKTTETPQHQSLNSSKLAYEHFLPYFMDLAHEEVWIAVLNTKSKPIKTVCLHQGGVNLTIMDPKIIFKTALDHTAAQFILAHNHPSGDTTPSSEDHRMTKKIKEAAKILEITFVDHIIVSNTGYYSFRDDNLI